MMRSRLFGLLAGLSVTVSGLASQAPPAVDTSKIGPQVCAAAPAFTGVDQFGTSHSGWRPLPAPVTQQAQKRLGAVSTVTITGALEYQACDEQLCYNPTRVPISFVVSVKELDRRPPR